MSGAPEKPRPHASEPGSNGRLDSWKEIAAYLRRSVRSARRWEKEEGLPVRRHVHGKGDSVYAYKTDLDGWWSNRGAKLGDENGAEDAASPPQAGTLDGSSSLEEPKREEEVASPPSHAPRRSALIGIGFGLAIVLVGVVAWLSRNGSGSAAGSLRPLPFKARDWVLVADFENRTGEKLFDGTLDYALGRELSNSRFVNVVPRERVGDALRLMRKPPDTAVNASIAREVCLRDGEIRALLTGRVEKLGSRYLLSVEVVDPKQGTTVASFSEEAPAIDESLASVRRISDRVRERLGETLPARDSDRPLVKVTTSNLRALQLYSQADALMAAVNYNNEAAEELLKQAVAEDPNFASAYIHLAWAIHNQGRPEKDYLPYAETAFRLSETTTERERYFIRGSYYQFIDDREKAIAAYETLISLHPDHKWGGTNLANLYLSEPSELPGKLEKAVQVTARKADLRPKDFQANMSAGYFLVVWIRDPTRAAPYLRRASDLITPEVAENWWGAWSISWMNILPFTQLWLRGDVAAAASELERIATRVGSLTGQANENLAVMTVQGYLALGKNEAAERVSEKIHDPVVRNDVLAELSFLKGDRLTLRKRLRSKEDRSLPMFRQAIAILQAREGFAAEAGRFLKHQQDINERDRPELHDVPGELALARGNLAVGISELEKATTLFGDFVHNGNGFQLSSESLAAALKRKGDLPRAIQVLERASERKHQAVIDGATGAYWMRNRLELARLYRNVGRVGEARATEADLRRLLALADPDHPIRRELDRLKGS